jgi:hypothetical protein
MSERKSKSLKIHLTPSHYAKLEALAAREGSGMGDWIAAQVQAARAPKMSRAQIRAGLTAGRRVSCGAAAE